MRMRPVTLTVVAAFVATVHLGARAGREQATQAATGAPPPEISVVGIRVVGAGLGKNREEIRPLNEQPGVAVALAIKMPAGQGIVDLDEDDCVLTSVTDDVGTDLGEHARYGAFPKTSADGSVGLIEIESRLRPAAKATAVLAEGELVFNASPGSKPTRIANVRLAKGQTFVLDGTTITLAEVTRGDQTSIELALPRSVLYTIRDVKFLDASGTPLEANRNGSGYINDDASVAYRITGAGAAVTLEFDVWQNLQQRKVPFKIKAGLALK